MKRSRKQFRGDRSSSHRRENKNRFSLSVLPPRSRLTRCYFRLAEVNRLFGSNDPVFRRRDGEERPSRSRFVENVRLEYRRAIKEIWSDESWFIRVV